MISIIIPTYNEAGSIRRLLEEIKKSLRKKSYEVIVVDDNSPDHTADIALSLKKTHHVKVIKRKSKLGLSSAVIDGLKIAKGNIIGVMDADFSHPPGLIQRLVQTIEKQDFDLVIGSRKIKGGSVEVWPFHRRLMSRFASALAIPLTKVKDPMSGFFFFKKEIIKDVKLKPLGYKILLEILVKGRQKKIKEIPYMFRNRTFGKSKIGSKVYLDYLRHIFRLYKYKITKKG